MTASRTRPVAFSAAVLLAALAWSGTALAQTGAPASSPPQALMPENPEAAVPEFQPGAHDNASVQVSTLGNPEGPPAGTLDETNGGLGADLWSGSARGELVPLLEKLPLAPAAPSMLALGRTLLLTRAEAPSGDSPQAFLTVRLKQLLEAGYVEEAGAIAATAVVPDDAAFARVQADAILLAGRADAACSDATATRLASDEPFWIELRAYCYAVADDTAMYDLTRQVMDAQNLNDGAFDILLDDVRNGAKDAPKPIDNPTALHVFLTEQAGLPVDPAMRRKAGAGTPFNADAAVTARINELALRSDAAGAAAYDLVVPSPDHAAFTQKILVQLVNAAPPESAYAALILGLYSELGEPLPPEAQARAGTVEATGWPGRRPAPMLMERIEAARGQPGRHGEALLALLVAAGDAGPGDLSPNVTLQFVRLLKEIGPPGAARAFARDALLFYHAP